jgi:hypothetical protein
VTSFIPIPLRTLGSFRVQILTPVRGSLVVHALWAITAATVLCSLASARDTLIIQAVAQPVVDDAKAEPQKDNAKKEDAKKDKPAERAKDNKDKKPVDKPARDADAESKKRNAAEKRKALVQAKAGPAAAQNGVEQQMHKQLEPMLKTEISFAARAAELKDDERRALIIAGKKWFDSFVADFVKNQDPNQQQMMLQGGGQMIWFGGPDRKVTDPREAIRKGLLNVATSTLTKEKSQAYADESKKREEFIRKVSIDNLVARIDEKVDVSADQRKKITESLTANLDKAHQPQLEAFAMNGNMWPGGSKESALPELTAAQKAVFNRLNSAAGQMFFGGNLFNVQGVEIDDVDLDEPTQNDKPDEPANTDSKSP